MSELLKGWKEEKLSYCVEPTKGKKPKILQEHNEDGFTPYIDIKAFELGEIRQYAEISSSKITTSNDILMVWDGARSGLIGKGFNGAIGSTIVALKPINILKEYLYYFLYSKYDYINTNHKGTGIPHIDPDILWNIDIPIPPLNEQKRIVERLELLLGKINRANEKLVKIPTIIKRFRQSILSAACSGKLTADWREMNSNIENAQDLLNRIDVTRKKLIYEGKIRKTKHDEVMVIETYPYEIPEKWSWCFLNDITTLITDGKHGDCQDEPNSGYYFLSAKDIQNGNLNYDNARQIKLEDFLEVHKRTNLEPGDICLVNTGATVGKLAIALDDERTSKTTFQKSVAVLKVLRDYINFQYIVYYLNSQSDLLLKKSTGSAINNLLISEIKQYLIALPSLLEQEEIVRRVDKLFALADKIDERYKNAKLQLERAEKAIYAKAFRGELVKQEEEE